MKFLVLFAVILLVVWYLRGQRAATHESASQPRPMPRPPRPAQEMVECAVCGVHLPRGEALPAPDGRLYCCDEHRKLGTA